MFRFTVLLAFCAFTCGLVVHGSRATAMEPCELAQLIPSDGRTLGTGVDLADGIAVVGAYFDSSSAGAAYVFRREKTTWLEQPKIEGPNFAKILFGFSVAASGGDVLVGAPFCAPDGSAPGRVYLYRPGGTSDCCSAHATPGCDDEACEQFLCAIAPTCCDTAWIAPCAFIANNDCETCGAWVEEELISSGASIDDGYGGSMAVDDDLLVVGAPGRCGRGLGLVYVFRREGAIWIEESELAADTGDPVVIGFGASVAVDGDRLVVGAPFSACTDGSYACGAAYIFRREGTGWVEEAKLSAKSLEAVDRFGTSVDISGEYVAVGAFLDDDAGINSGSAFMFRLEDGAWMEVAKLIPPDIEAGDSFGGSVALDGDLLLVGAPGDDELGSEEGAVYLYERMGTNWTEVEKLLPNNPTRSNSFGLSLSFDGQLALIGGLGAYVYGIAGDCNDNGVVDSCEIAAGQAEDCDDNLTPDECEPDCNENGIADACDILAGTSEDSDENDVPDECDVEAIPAASHWTLLVMVLIILVIGKVRFSRRHGMSSESLRGFLLCIIGPAR